MIRSEFKHPLVPRTENLHLVFTPNELDKLRALAAKISEWEPGRQGSGYFKLDLKPYARFALYDADRWLQPIVERMASILLGSKRSFEPVRDTRFWENLDAWLLFYPNGSWVAWHKDLAPEGKIHRRMNVVVTAPRAGGVLKLEVIGPCGITVSTPRFDLSENEGVIFEPSEYLHGVEPIEGTRLVFSMGALVDR